MFHRLKTFYDSCKDNDQQLDIFSVNQLLTMLESSCVQVLHCFESGNKKELHNEISQYLKQLKPLNQSIKTLIIPILHDSHFNGYIVSLETSSKAVIYVDSIILNASEGSDFSKQIKDIVLDHDNVSHQTLYTEQMQLDTNSCGIWLVAGMISHVLEKSLPRDRDEAFNLVSQLISVGFKCLNESRTNAVGGNVNLITLECLTLLGLPSS